MKARCSAFTIFTRLKSHHWLVKIVVVWLSVPVLWLVQYHHITQSSSLIGYQFAMPGLLRVMKYIWHEEPPLALEKKTWNNVILNTSSTFTSSTLSYLVISLTQELEFLSFLMHEHSVQVSSLHAPDLNGFVAPAHDLPGPDVSNTGGQLSPLQHNILGHLETISF